MIKKILNLRNAVDERSRSMVAAAICLAVTCIMFSGCKDDDERSFGMTYHENNVKLEITYQNEIGSFTASNHTPWIITGGLFTITAFDVTKGQDPNEKLGIGDIYHLWDKKEFCFILGRKASKEVAVSFNQACPPARNTFNHTADELNFWVKGTMVLTFSNGKTYTFPDTFFAQGHTGAANNWWFGNSTMTNRSASISLYDYFTHQKLGSVFYEYDYGLVSPKEDPNLVFKFLRGAGLSVVIGQDVNCVNICGLYLRDL
jgi:hypothetical protein